MTRALVGYESMIGNTAAVSPRPLGIREWLDELRSVSRAVSAATFDTRISRPRLPGSAAHAARRRLPAEKLSISKELTT